MPLFWHNRKVKQSVKISTVAFFWIQSFLDILGYCGKSVRNMIWNILRFLIVLHGVATNSRTTVTNSLLAVGYL